MAWLQDAIEPVYRARLRLPAAPVRFPFRPAGGSSAVVGVMIASADRVGRAFPLCLFAVAPAAALAERFPAVPLAYRAFLDAAEALLAEAASLHGPTLAACAAALAVPLSAPR